MRPFTKQFDTIYSLVCQKMTLGEQKQVYGTVGLKNILKIYPKDDAINMAYNYISRRDGEK